MTDQVRVRLVASDKTPAWGPSRSNPYFQRNSMTYLQNLAPFFSRRHEEMKNDWNELMTSEIRDWSRIIETHPRSLACYIESVITESGEYLPASKELDTLRSAYSWDESYFVNWEIEVTSSNPTVSIEYPSLEQAQHAEEDGIEPEKSAFDAWEEEGCIPEVSWGSPVSTAVCIRNLELRNQTETPVFTSILE